MSAATEAAPTLPPLPVAEVAVQASTETSAEVANLAVDTPGPVITDSLPPVVDASAPEPEEPTVAEPKVEEIVKAEEEKKEKKPARKPFADLLNKIRKPLEKSTAEKKEPQAAPAEEVPSETPAAAEPATEAPSAAEATSDVPVTDAPIAEEAAKDITTPRKERGNIFEKITAFVLKPKSPKGKKHEPEAADPAVVAETEPSPDVAATSGDAPAAEPVEVPAPAAEAATEPVEEVSPAVEAPEEPKPEKKTPKDLAKLARRFSGRLFGTPKNDKSAKKPEATQEEGEESAAADATTAAPSDPAPVESAVEPVSAAESTPVIAATA